MVRKENEIKVSSPSPTQGLHISSINTKQVIDATNNRAQYYADLAKKYRDEAKQHRDNAKYYSEQNSDVTVEYIDSVKAELIRKMDAQDTQLEVKFEQELTQRIPKDVSELNNDVPYVKKDDFDTVVKDLELPSQIDCGGKFLYTDGESTSWKEIPSSFNLFDIILKDHILTYEESKGLALQGTYVYKEAIAGSRYGYPDFYNKCLEERNAATATQVTLSGSTITMYVASNGHQYYDIANKDVVDNFFGTMGSAWFYGVDVENERVFLPRKSWLELNPHSKIPVIGNGNGLGLATSTDTSKYYPIAERDSDDSEIFTHTARTSPVAIGASIGNATGGVANGVAIGVSTNPEFSGLTTDLTSVIAEQTEKYLYICVGNTESVSSVTDVVEITTTENDTMPLLTGMYFDFTPNNISWLKGGEQKNSGGVYTFCYNELVNVLNGETKYGDLKVINEADMIAGIDYSEYWKVNQDAMTFTTPTAISIAEQSTAQLYFKVANAVQNLELLDVGEVMEVVADKISRHDCKAYITETYVNGTSWYRVYSDSWCEQGGHINSVSGANQIVFLKPFFDTNYFIELSRRAGATTTTNVTHFIRGRKVTSCEVYTSGATSYNWYACGYIA